MAILIPTGGLGNRIRFLNSASSILAKDKKIIIVNFITDMFPEKIDRYIDFDPNQYRVINLKFKSEKLLLQILKFVFFWGFLFRLTERYGTRSIKRNEKGAVSSCHMIEGGDIASNPLKKSYLFMKWRFENNQLYNAIHIRRGDNERAIRQNQIKDYKNFILTSKYPVYIATDDLKLKNMLLKEFSEKIISSNVTLDRSNSFSQDDSFFEFCVLINAEIFKGSIGSSFSTVADAYRNKIKEVQR